MSPFARRAAFAAATMLAALSMAGHTPAFGADLTPGAASTSVLDSAPPGPVAVDIAPVDLAQSEAQAKTDYNLLPALPPVLTGRVKTIHLVAEVKHWSPAPGVDVDAWTYNGTVPGPTIHVREGDTLRVILTNHLPAPTTVHWHGMSVPADMDGTPGFSQAPVQPGQSFVYQFVVRQPGTYIYHTHVDDLNQLDRGLYGAVVVEPSVPESPRPTKDFLMLISSWKIFSTTENYFSVNGKSYPLGKPFMVRQNERVRVRLIDISGTEFH